MSDNTFSNLKQDLILAQFKLHELCVGHQPLISNKYDPSDCLAGNFSPATYICLTLKEQKANKPQCDVWPSVVIVTNARQCSVGGTEAWITMDETQLPKWGGKDTSVWQFRIYTGLRQQSSKFLYHVTNELDKSDGSGGWKWPSLPWLFRNKLPVSKISHAASLWFNFLQTLCWCIRT